MKCIRVAAAVLNQTPLDWEGNKARILDAVHAARQRGVQVLCLPEMCITGYGCEDAFLSPGVQRIAGEILAEILPETSGMIVSVGLPVWHHGGLFNTAGLLVDGQLAGLVGKQNLPGEGLHYEPRWFKPWPADEVTTTELLGRQVPLGDIIFDCGGIRIGFEICEDAWVATRPGSDLAQHGVDVILNPSASHFAFGKHEVRKRFVLEGSRAFSVAYVYANLLGNEAGRAIYDGDAMIANCGEMIAVGPRFSFADSHLTTAVLDVDAARMNRARTSSFQPDVSGLRSHWVRAAFTFSEVLPEESPIETADWERGGAIKAEEFSRVVALGLYDYLRKSRSRGFIVSLSGGADSAAVATLVGLMVRMGTGQLGRTGFVKKLDYIPELDQAQDAAALTSRLLTCVYQATRNSSDTTRHAARDVALGLNARFLQFDVDSLVQDYIETVSASIGRKLTWEQDDIALQNIQARVRAPGVWMLANIDGALLLSTSNRSEAAVGYATMDGDTSGGLCPIAGIDKAYLLKWLQWMEREGPHGVGPVPELRAVNVQQPTAELRPPSATQTDEKDLMPYEVLDVIERAAIRDKLLPVEVLQRIEPKYAAQYDLEQLRQWVARFFRLWARNQWKRERYAPSFHLDDENLDPKTWCRFPILSGGFDRELQALDAYQRKGTAP